MRPGRTGRGILVRSNLHLLSGSRTLGTRALTLIIGHCQYILANELSVFRLVVLHKGLAGRMLFGTVLLAGNRHCQSDYALDPFIWEL